MRKRDEDGRIKVACRRIDGARRDAATTSAKAPIIWIRIGVSKRPLRSSKSVRRYPHVVQGTCVIQRHRSVFSSGHRVFR